MRERRSSVKKENLNGTVSAPPISALNLPLKPYRATGAGPAELRGVEHLLVPRGTGPRIKWHGCRTVPAHVKQIIWNHDADAVTKREDQTLRKMQE